jgi:hypothetical protein
MHHVRGTNFERALRMCRGASSVFVNGVATRRVGRGRMATPVDVTSALGRLDAPYLPLVALQAAGIPLDASFSEQRAILQRCEGLFYSCEGGRQANRLNRLLMNAGLIKGL